MFLRHTRSRLAAKAEDWSMLSGIDQLESENEESEREDIRTLPPPLPVLRPLGHWGDKMADFPLARQFYAEDLRGRITFADTMLTSMEDEWGPIMTWEARFWRELPVAEAGERQTRQTWFNDRWDFVSRGRMALGYLDHITDGADIRKDSDPTGIHNITLRLTTVMLTAILSLEH